MKSYDNDPVYTNGVKDETFSVAAKMLLDSKHEVDRFNNPNWSSITVPTLATDPDGFARRYSSMFDSLNSAAVSSASGHTVGSVGDYSGWSHSIFDQDATRLVTRAVLVTRRGVFVGG